MVRTRHLETNTKRGNKSEEILGVLSWGTLIDIKARTNRRTDKHRDTNRQTHIHTHTRAHTHTYARTHTHTHIHTLRSVDSNL